MSFFGDNSIASQTEKDGSAKQIAKRARRNNALTNMNQRNSSSSKESRAIKNEEDLEEREEVEELKNQLRVVRQYTQWYLRRANIDGMEKARLYRANSETKQLKALDSMSLEDADATRVWLENYVTTLLAVKQLGWWAVKTGVKETETTEDEEEKLFKMNDLLGVVKEIEEEGAEGKGKGAANQPSHALALPFRPSKVAAQ